MHKVKSIIISAGRSCFVKCTGCYNFFGKNTQLTDTDTILNFLSQLTESNIEKVTVGGGDPLSRPDIIKLLSGIKSLGFSIYLDTVGSSLLSNTETIFYGHNKVNKIDPHDIAQFTDLVGIPLDGSTQEIASKFRTGRDNLFNEQIDILSLLENKNIPICINTVVNKHNSHDLINIYSIIKNYANVVEWQLFQYMPIGPMGYKNREQFSIDDNIYNECVNNLTNHINDFPSSIKVNPKSRVSRKGRYLLIDTDGVAWCPSVSSKSSWDQNIDENKERIVFGNINHLEEQPQIIDYILGHTPC